MLRATDHARGRPTTTTLVALAVLTAGLTLGGWFVAGSAQAHATIVSSNPTDGARLNAAPDQVSITFDEPVGIGQVGYLHVIDQAGRRVDAGAAEHPGGNGALVVTPLQPGLGQGVYTESWRVISADSHPVAGTIRFAVGNAVLTPQTTVTAATDPALGAVFAVVRLIGFVGLALLGAVWVPLTLWAPARTQRRFRRIIWTGWGLTAVGTLGQLALQGPYGAGEGPTSALRLHLISATLPSSYGQALLARLALLVLLAFVLETLQRAESTPGGYERSLFALLLIALAWTFSTLGHPRTTSPAWLSEPLDMVHLLAMAIWVGGLVALALVCLPAADSDDLTDLLPRFSRVAMVAVVALAVTGTYAAWRGIGTLSALSTTYALLVLAKVVLFVVVLAVANVSRTAAGRRLNRTVADRSRIRGAVLLEIAVAVVVLAVSAVLVAQPRGHEALITRQLRPVSATVALGGGRTVQLTIDPGRHGIVSAYASLSPGPAAQSLQITAALPAAQLGPIPLDLRPDGPQRFSAAAVDLPVPGAWTFTIIVSTSLFDATTADTTLRLA